MDYEKEYDEAVKQERTESVKALYMVLDEEGDKITGRFLDIGKVMSSMNDKEYNQYLFETTDGLVKFPLSTTVDVEAETIFKKGEIYMIEYLGKTKTTKGFEVKDFNIQHVISIEAAAKAKEDTEKAEGDEK